MKVANPEIKLNLTLHQRYVWFVRVPLWRLFCYFWIPTRRWWRLRAFRRSTKEWAKAHPDNYFRG
jgi:hypothetical protein